MILKPMKRRDLKLMAESYGVEWRWKSSKRIRRDIRNALGVYPIRSLQDLKTCRGVRDVTKQEWSLGCTVTLHHKWWGWPFIKSNLTTLEIFASNKFPAGVTFFSRATVDNPSWRVSLAIGVVIAVALALLVSA